MPNTALQMVTHQLKTFFGITNDDTATLGQLSPTAVERCLFAFQQINNKYYQQNTSSVNPLHSSQYAMFLYFLSKEASKTAGMSTLADKIYYLNKSLNNCELYHAIELPDIMYFDHPLGSIMGRAQYSNHFSFQQGCCVGNNHSIYPTIGQRVHMFANSTIIGQSTIGNRVFISANTYIKDQNIPDNSIVFGTSPNLEIITKPDEYFDARNLFTSD